MKKKVITIIGNIGSGKSSALPIVAKHFKAQSIEADNLFQTTDPFAMDYLKDMQRWAFTNELWLTVERVKLICGEMETGKAKTVVIDSGLLMSWVYTFTHYTAGRLTKAEWDFFCELYDSQAACLLDNSMIIFMNYSIPTLLKRIAKRGREYELEYYSRAFLEELQQGLEALVKTLKSRGLTVREIKEEHVPDFVEMEQGEQSLIRALDLRT